MKSAGTVGNWEAGHATPSVESLAYLADLFGFSTDYLLGRSRSSTVQGNAKNDADPKLLGLLDMIECCDEIAQETILGCIDLQYTRCTREPERPKKSCSYTRPVFLTEGKDADYYFMKDKLVLLRGLRRAQKHRKSFADITSHLWGIWYGDKICLAYILDIFGVGSCERVPSPELYAHIESVLSVDTPTAKVVGDYPGL